MPIVRMWDVKKILEMDCELYSCYIAVFLTSLKAVLSVLCALKLGFRSMPGVLAAILLV